MRHRASPEWSNPTPGVFLSNEARPRVYRESAPCPTSFAGIWAWLSRQNDATNSEKHGPLLLRAKPRISPENPRSFAGGASHGFRRVVLGLGRSFIHIGASVPLHASVRWRGPKAAISGRWRREIHRKHTRRSALHTSAAPNCPVSCLGLQHLSLDPQERRLLLSSRSCHHALANVHSCLAVGKHHNRRPALWMHHHDILPLAVVATQRH